MSADFEQVKVELIGIPVDLWLRATAHVEAIQREFDIIRSSTPAGSAPNQLQDFADTLDVRLVDAGEPVNREVLAAADRGDARVDVSVEVPRAAAGAVKTLDVILDEVDDFCREGETLLTLATPEDLVLFRRWMIGEYIDQIEEGASPTSWEEFAGRREPSSASGEMPSPSTAANEGVIGYSGELDLSSAGDLQARIQDSRAQGINELILDLIGVTFIDSVGLSLLVSAHNRMEEEGGSLTILLSPRLKSLFELSGLVDLLRVEFRDS